MYTYAMNVHIRYRKARMLRVRVLNMCVVAAAAAAVDADVARNVCIGSNPLSGQPVNNLLTIKIREKK